MFKAYFIGGSLNPRYQYLDIAPIPFDAYEDADEPALSYGEPDEIDFSNVPAAKLVHTYERDDRPTPSDCRDECPGYVYRDMGVNK